MIELTNLPLGSNTPAEARILWNEALRLLEEAVNSFGGMVDTSTNEVKNTKKVIINNGDNTKPNANAIGLETNSIIKTLSDILSGGRIVGKTLELGVDSGLALQVTKGDAYVGNGNTNFELNGRMILDRGLVFDSFKTVFNSAEKANYYSGSTPNFVDTGSEIIGLISMRNTASKILNFSTYVALNEELNVRKVRILAEDTLSIGSYAVIVCIKPSDSEETFVLDKETLLYHDTMSQGVMFTESYQSVTLMFAGTGWVPINLQGCTIV